MPSEMTINSHDGVIAVTTDTLPWTEAVRCLKLQDIKMAKEQLEINKVGIITNL